MDLVQFQIMPLIFLMVSMHFFRKMDGARPPLVCLLKLCFMAWNIVDIRKVLWNVNTTDLGAVVLMEVA